LQIVAVTKCALKPRGGRPRTTGLLQGVSQLVRQKLSAGTSLRRILARTEDHITTHRIGERIDRSRRFRSVGAGMHAHLAEVVAEAWFEEGSSDSIQRLAGA